MCPDFGRECLGDKCVSFMSDGFTRVSSDSFKGKINNYLLSNTFPIDLSFRVNYCTKYDAYVDIDSSDFKNTEKEIANNFIPWKDDSTMEIY